MSTRARGIVLLGCGLCLAAPGCLEPQSVPLSPVMAQSVTERAKSILKAELACKDNPVVRAAAVEALQEVGTPDVLPWIQSAMLDEHPGVRFATCMAVGKLRDRTAESAVRRCLTDQSDHVRLAALYAMHRLGYTQQTGKLAGYLLDHPDVTVRRNAAITLTQLGERSAIPILARAMKDPDAGVRNHALEGMARLGNKDAARELTFMANSGVGSEEVFALNALAATGDPAFEDAYRYKLASGAHLETRLAAARGLGLLRIDEGLPVAVEALRPTQPVRNDPDDPPAEQLLRIRQLAASAVGAIGSPAALPALEPWLADSVDARIRVSAARAVVEISRRDRSNVVSFHSVGGL